MSRRLPAPEPESTLVNGAASPDLQTTAAATSRATSEGNRSGTHSRSAQKPDRSHSRKSRKRPKSRQAKQSKQSLASGTAAESQDLECTLGKTLSAIDSGIAKIAATEPSQIYATKQIEHYREIEELGRGGWGVVQRAFDRRLEREVAVKSLSSSVAAQPGVKQAFEHEAKITSQLQHPGIVPVHEAGQTLSGESFYAMKLLEGSSLKDAIRAAHLENPPRNRAQLRRLCLPLLSRFVSVCNAVAFAHTKQILHRDLKPANVMVGNFGETLVVDWGLATKFEATGSEQSARPFESTQVGTPAYMSPEQASGLRTALSPASDIYSLGVMLFEVVSGTSPCVWAERTQSDTDSAQSITERVLARVADGDLPSLRQVNPLAPKSLEAICRKAMAHSPADRYESADQLAEDVSRFIEGGVPTVYREPLFDKCIRWCTNHKAITAVITIASLILLAASIVFGVTISKAHRQEQAARVNAELSRADALDRLAQARETADKWLIDLSGSLQFYPGMQTLREELLQTALSDYKALLNASTAAQPLADSDPKFEVRQLLEKARLHLRMHDLVRLAPTGGNDSNADVPSSHDLLNAADTLLSDATRQLNSPSYIADADSKRGIQRQIRLESVNLLIASLLDGAAVPDSEFDCQRAWLNKVAEEIKRQSTAPLYAAKIQSALLRLHLAASTQPSNDAPVTDRLEFAESALTHASTLVSCDRNDANLRLFETAISNLAELHSDCGNTDAAASTWQKLIECLRQSGHIERSDRLQSIAYALMRQADALSSEQPARSVELLDEAIDVLHRSWRALDPSQFFETNLATAKFNSAKLMLVKSEGDVQAAAERLNDALRYYQTILQQEPTADILRRLAECHQLLASTCQGMPAQAAEHYRSSLLASELLCDHDLATIDDLFTMAETQLHLSNLTTTVPGHAEDLRSQARELLSMIANAGKLSDQQIGKLEQLQPLARPN